LKSKDGNIKIKNCNFLFNLANIINLCFALVDDKGKWINLNRVGDSMIKGKA
jgi:hypothetical protein